MPEIINRQRKVEINHKLFVIFAEKVVKTVFEAKGKTFTLVFVSDRKMRELNKTFRNKNSTTDVLSFPFESEEFEALENNLGDIVISVQQAEKQAKENNLDFETEIKQLILHGVLHLGGYDHETDAGEMNELELRLRAKLKI